MSFQESRHDSAMPISDRLFLAAVKAELDIFDIQDAVTADFTANKHPMVMGGNIAATLGTVAFNSTKIPLVTMPTIALETLQHSDNSVVAGAVTGAAYGVWTLLTTGMVDKALNDIPATRNWLEHRHPSQIEVIIDAFPGLDENNEEDKSAQKVGARIFKSIGTHAVRGVTAVGAGANFYVVAANLEEQPRRARGRLRRRLSVDGGAVMGTIAGLSAEAVRQINDSNPALAEQIHDGATNPWIGFGVAASLMTVQTMKKRWTKRRQATQQARLEQELTVPELAEVD